MGEDEARGYFHQLINAVDFCHNRGVYHRDFKPENLLLDTYENLKISNFGLSVLSHQVRDDGLLHTSCGTPNYVAPEVLNDGGYDGATADLWSCGVILFVLLSSYMSFDDSNLMRLYEKISNAEFSCPSWFSAGATKLLKRILRLWRFLSLSVCIRVVVGFLCSRYVFRVIYLFYYFAREIRVSLCVGVWQHDRVEIIANVHLHSCFPLHSPFYLLLLDCFNSIGEFGECNLC